MTPERELLVATRSLHKLRELRELIKLSGFQLVSLDEAGGPEKPC